MREYRVSEDILENDLAEYVHYLLNSGFITMDGIEIKGEQYRTKTNA